jgi:hypothetical protein
VHKLLSRIVGAVCAFLLISCNSGARVVASPTHSAVPSLIAASPQSTPFNPNVFDVKGALARIGPPEVAPGLCGENPLSKLVFRVDPLVELTPGQWQLRGCVALREHAPVADLTLRLAFADEPTEVIIHLADVAAVGKGFDFEVRLTRSNVSGLEAKIYFRCDPGPC